MASWQGNAFPTAWNFNIIFITSVSCLIIRELQVIWDAMTLNWRHLDIRKPNSEQRVDI